MKKYILLTVISLSSLVFSKDISTVFSIRHDNLTSNNCNAFKYASGSGLG